MGRHDLLLVLNELMELKPGDLTGHEVLADLDGWDSLALVEFIATVDKQFGASVSAKRIARCATVNELVAAVVEGPGPRETPLPGSGPEASRQPVSG